MKPLLKNGIYALCLYLPVFMVQADPLYLQQLESAAIDEKKLQEAQKQIKDYSEITLKEDLFVANFHKQNPAQATDKKSFCSNCHLLPPHKESQRKRSFLNMHSRYISCETCHFQPDNVQLEYRWLNFNNSNNKIPAKRITPFYNNEAVVIFADHELAKQVKQDWDKKSWGKQLSEEESLEKAKLKLRIHAPLIKKAPMCLDCHDNKEQLLNLESLDFSEKEISKLQQHSIPRFFGRYTKDGTKDEQRLRMTDLLE